VVLQNNQAERNECETVCNCTWRSNTPMPYRFGSNDEQRTRPTCSLSSETCQMITTHNDRIDRDLWRVLANEKGKKGRRYRIVRRGVGQPGEIRSVGVYCGHPAATNKQRSHPKPIPKHRRCLSSTSIRGGYGSCRSPSLARAKWARYRLIGSVCHSLAFVFIRRARFLSQNIP
jgi:hypothetical protein